MITFHTDNQNDACIVQMIALSFFNICMSYKIDMHTIWIVRIENQRVDILNRIIDIRLLGYYY